MWIEKGEEEVSELEGPGIELAVQDMAMSVSLFRSTPSSATAMACVCRFFLACREGVGLTESQESDCFLWESSSLSSKAVASSRPAMKASISSEVEVGFTDMIFELDLTWLGVSIDEAFPSCVSGC